MKKFKFSFFIKLFVCFAIASIIPVLILGALTFSISSRISMNNVKNQTLQTADKAAQSLDHTMSEYDSALSYFCNDNEIVEIVSKPIVTEKSKTIIWQKMYIMLAGKPITIAMHLIKADGTFSISTSAIPEAYDIKNHDNWGVFRKLDSSDYTIEYSNRYSRGSTNYCITIAHNIKKNGAVIGYVIIDIPTEVFKTALDMVNGNYPVKYTVMDKNYYLLFDEALNSNNKNFLDADIRNKIDLYKDSRKMYLENPQRVITWSNFFGDNDMIVFSSVSVELLKINNSYITITTFIVAIFAVLICLALSPLIIRGLTRPLNKIVETMNKVQNGDKNARVIIKNKDEFGFIGASLNSMLDNLNELYQNDLEKQNRLRLAEMKALYSQINPHFLYNTLDSIKWLAKLKGADDIVMIVSQLGKLLKNSINNQKDYVQVDEEISLVKSYLAIQKVRYDDKFDVDIDIDESVMKCIIPKLIIQPIVENAIIHGIEDKISKAYLKIKGWKESNKIIFEVIDDGVGISEDKLAQIGCNHTEDFIGKDSIGLANVDKRIKLYYGQEYGVEIESELNVGTVTKITIPFTETVYSEGK